MDFSYMGQKGESVIEIHLQVVSMPSLRHSFSAQILLLLSTGTSKTISFSWFLSYEEPSNRGKVGQLGI